MEPKIKRRSRRILAPQGNPPVISARDVAIFRLLTRYRYLDSRQLWQLLPTSVRCYPQPERQRPDRQTKRTSAEIAFRVRLRKLADWGFIDRSLNGRLPPQMRFMGYEIHEIGDEAVLYLSRAGIHEEDITGLSVGSTLQFSHALMICSTLASLEIGAMQAGVRFITWQEILAKAPQETRHAKHPWLFPEVSIEYKFPNGVARNKIRLKPDCPPFGFEYTQTDGKKLYRFATIEAERANKVWANNLDDTSWLKKALGYRELRQSRKLFTHFNLPNFYIIVVAPSKGHVESMKSLVMDVTNKAGSEMYLFSPIPVYGRHYESLPPFPEIFTTPLECAGRPSLTLAKL